MKKRRKSGFTLIELLAVILILAIIAIITIPIILNVIERSEMGAFRDSVYGVVSSGEINIAEELAKGNEVEFPLNYDFNIDANNILKYKGKRMISGDVYFEDEGSIGINYLTDGKYCAVGNFEDFVVTKGDCTRPSIYITYPRPKPIYRSYRSNISLTAISTKGEVSWSHNLTDSDIELSSTSGNTINVKSKTIEEKTVIIRATNTTDTSKYDEYEVKLMPYVPVYTASDMNDVRLELDEHYKLMNDIDLATYDNWDPIGKNVASEAFKGRFDGTNYRISNLKIERPTEDRMGLFRYGINAEFKNIILVNVNINGGSIAASLLGGNGGSTIHNCHALSGTVISDYWAAGLIGDSGGATSITNSGAKVNVTARIYGAAGLAANFHASGSGSIIKNCYATGNVISTAGWYAAGLVGISYANIENSYATGNASGHNSVGGLVGSARGTKYIKNSYATGNAVATLSNGVGGLIGDTGQHTEIMTISNSYALGTARYNSSLAGGLVGVATVPESLVVQSSYFNSNNENNSLGVVKTLAQLKQASTYAGWDTNIWNIVEGQYPTLKNMPN